MRRIHKIYLLFLFLSICFTAGYSMISIPDNSTVAQSISGTFTHPDFIDTISLIQPDDSNIKKNYILITHSDETSEDTIWQSPPAPVWKILLADVTGNGNNEVALCLHKTEPYDSKKDNRLHIYTWDDGYFRAVWRGTFLSKPFLNLAFGNLNEDDAEELISVERAGITKKNTYLCIYSWNGFGFDLITQSAINYIPEDITINNNISKEIILHHSNPEQTQTYTYNPSTLTINRKE